MCAGRMILAGDINKYAEHRKHFQFLFVHHKSHRD
jgi:hypothetical protein